MDNDFAEELLRGALGLSQAIGSKEIVQLPRNTALRLVELLRQAAARLTPTPDQEDRELTKKD